DGLISVASRVQERLSSGSSREFLEPLETRHCDAVLAAPLLEAAANRAKSLPCSRAESVRALRHAGG
ncbi:unnamed protein product, partial [Polarella glacialis]